MAKSVKALLYIHGALKQNFFYNLSSEMYPAIFNRQKCSRPGNKLFLRSLFSNNHCVTFLCALFPRILKRGSQSWEHTHINNSSLSSQGGEECCLLPSFSTLKYWPKKTAAFTRLWSNSGKTTAYKSGPFTPGLPFLLAGADLNEIRESILVTLGNNKDGWVKMISCECLNLLNFWLSYRNDIW